MVLSHHDGGICIKRLRLPTHNPFCRLSFFSSAKEKGTGCDGKRESFRARSNYRRRIHSHCAFTAPKERRGEIVIKMIMKNHLLTMCDYNSAWCRGQETGQLMIYHSIRWTSLFRWCLLSLSSREPLLKRFHHSHKLAKFEAQKNQQRAVALNSNPANLNQYQLWVVKLFSASAKPKSHLIFNNQLISRNTFDRELLFSNRCQIK